MKRFTRRHIRNGYAAMGNSMRRPHYKGVSGRSVAEAIAAERRKAAREAAAKRNKK